MFGTVRVHDVPSKATKKKTHRKNTDFFHVISYQEGIYLLCVWLFVPIFASDVQLILFFFRSLLVWVQRSGCMHRVFGVFYFFANCNWCRSMVSSIYHFVVNVCLLYSYRFIGYLFQAMLLFLLLVCFFTFYLFSRCFSFFFISSVAVTDRRCFALLAAYIINMYMHLICAFYTYIVIVLL